METWIREAEFFQNSDFVLVKSEPNNEKKLTEICNKNCQKKPKKPKQKYRKGLKNRKKPIKTEKNRQKVEKTEKNR